MITPIKSHLIKIGHSVLLICLIFNFSLTPLFAQGNVQSRKITMNKANTTLAVLFKEIEKKSDFQFFYDASEIDDSQKISISVLNSDIEEVLSIMFKNLEIKYEIANRNIILKKKDTPNKSDVLPTNQQQSLIKGRVLDLQGEPLP